MTDTTNRALWQDGVGVPGAIRESPLATRNQLGDHKVLIKVHAWAINPCDHMLQDRNMVNYPLILGCDVAGTIEAVPSASTSLFRVGDRVFGFSANNGFQDYVQVEDRLITKIPDGMAYRDVVGFGLCSATSAMYLFGQDYLALEYPTLKAPKQEKSVLVWGGASAVGSNAIQLVSAAGYEVITTCSKQNFDYVKKLGAAEAYDYRDLDVVDKVAAKLDKGICAGVFMAAGLKEGNVAACRTAAASKQMLSLASSDYIFNLNEMPKGNFIVKQPTPEQFKPFPDCWFETTQATFGGYLPEALANDVYEVAPQPLVVNRKGLEGIQEAVDLMRIVSEKGLDGIRDVFERLRGGVGTDDLPPVKLIVERA